MSKRGYISRYALILKKLKAKPYTSYEELSAYINNQLDYLQMHDDDLQMGFSKRTFQRDMKEIRNVFGVDIVYSKSEKGYFIEDGIGENMNFQRMMEAFDLFNSLNLADDLTSFVHLEKRRPQGTENLYGLIHAIKNKLMIQFDYQKFWDEKPSNRQAKPFALKEFDNRWYVIVTENNSKQIKSFALDRMTNFNISNIPFYEVAPVDLQEYYRYCFGIISPNQHPLREVILSFDAFQGKYIKTLPLHHTQQILIDNEHELRIQLKLYITEDFIMEVLSHGARVKVLEPQELIDEVKNSLMESMKHYAS